MNARSLPLLLLATNFLYVGAAAEPRHILVCGSAQVLEGVIEQNGGKPVFTVKWTWPPESSRGFPITLKSNFAGTDECKPAANGARILITTSGNGLALVE